MAIYPTGDSRRLREYNERTSRILGGRLSVSCDHGVSLMCLVNNPFFDAVAAPWYLTNREKLDEQMVDYHGV